MKTVNLAVCFDRVPEPWSPHIVGEVNDCYVKVAKLDGPFCWHQHEAEDELFLVVQGTLRMQFRDPDGTERESTINPGEFLIVPRGVEHCPVADGECHVVLFEPKSTLNTGDVRNERTRNVLERI